MVRSTRSKRFNQRRRTRKDLLEGAARLLKEGRKPSLEDVAEEALVSRATAYRYFPGVEALLAEAVVDVAVSEASELFGNETSDDPVIRLQHVDDMLHKSIVENENSLRIVLAHSLERRAKEGLEQDAPVRQNRRTPLIEAALAPAREQLDVNQYEDLTSALALILGTEAMMVFRDVLQLDYEKAREVKRWAIRALVDAAMQGDGMPTNRTLSKQARTKQ